MKIFPHAVASVAAVLTALAPIVANAALLINPAGGTALSFGSDYDDGSVQRDLGGSLPLYGTAQTQLFVQVNGFLSVGDGLDFHNDSSLSALAGGKPSALIAPLYDDLFWNVTIPGEGISESVTAGYYAVTWDIEGTQQQGPRSQFQAALFKNATTVNNTAYRAGDIFFSYGGLNVPVASSTLTVGVAQNATNFAAPFGSPDGQFSSTQDLLSNFDPTTQGILFRPDSANGYTAAVVPLFRVAVIPEAGAGLLAALALPLLAAVARRR